MITKFHDYQDESTSIEFIPKQQTLTIVTDNGGVTMQITITEQDLFNLIGQLLRIQSDIRKSKEVPNG